MSGVARRETLKSRFSYRKCVLMSDIISLDDSPRRKANVLQTIKSIHKIQFAHHERAFICRSFLFYVDVLLLLHGSRAVHGLVHATAVYRDWLSAL